MNHLTIEKNFCVFLKNNTDYLGNENYFLENVNNTRIDDQSFSKKLNFRQTTSFGRIDFISVDKSSDSLHPQQISTFYLTFKFNKLYYIYYTVIQKKSK